MNIIKTKKCPKCGESKKFIEFSLGKKCKDGRQSVCKKCMKKYNQQWYANHPNYSCQYYIDHEEQRLEYNKQWETNHKEQRLKQHKQWRINHPKHSRQWCINHPERTREIQRKSNKKTKNTPKGKLNTCMHTAVYYSLKGSKAGCRWKDLVGYTIDQLKTHLGKLFKPGMTWNNYGTEWSIDHKIPISAFNFISADDIDFKRCWALKNLQPLWKLENLKKGTKLDKPFQPSLRIAIKRNLNLPLPRCNSEKETLALSL